MASLQVTQTASSHCAHILAERTKHRLAFARMMELNGDDTPLYSNLRFASNEASSSTSTSTSQSRSASPSPAPHVPVQQLGQNQDTMISLRDHAMPQHHLHQQQLTLSQQQAQSQIELQQHQTMGSHIMPALKHNVVQSHSAFLHSQQRQAPQHVERRAPEQQARRQKTTAEWRSQEALQQGNERRSGVRGLVAVEQGTRASTEKKLSLRVPPALPPVIPPIPAHAGRQQSSSSSRSRAPDRWYPNYPPPDPRYQLPFRRRQLPSSTGTAPSTSASASPSVASHHASMNRLGDRFATAYSTYSSTSRNRLETVHGDATRSGYATTNSMKRRMMARSMHFHDPSPMGSRPQDGDAFYARRNTFSSSSSSLSPGTSTSASQSSSVQSSPGTRASASEVAALFGASVASPPAKRIKTYLEPQSDNMALLCSAIFSLGPLKENPRGCSCPKSKCLALYCDCFKAGRRCCQATCACLNCKNTVEESGANGARTKAIQALLARNPRAFIAPDEPTERKTVAPGGNACNCVRSRCVKKYCVCYQKGKKCDPSVCSCVGCLNVGDEKADAEKEEDGKKGSAEQSKGESQDDAHGTGSDAGSMATA